MNNDGEYILKLKLSLNHFNDSNPLKLFFVQKNLELVIQIPQITIINMADRMYRLLKNIEKWL